MHAHGGGLERGSVVGAVADEQGCLPVGGERLDVCFLLVGLEAGVCEGGGYVEGARDGERRGGVVACEEVNAEAAVLEAFDGGRSGGAEGGGEEEGCAMGGRDGYAEVGGGAGLGGGEERRGEGDGEPGGGAGADEDRGWGGALDAGAWDALNGFEIGGLEVGVLGWEGISKCTR